MEKAIVSGCARHLGGQGDPGPGAGQAGDRRPGDARHRRARGERGHDRAERLHGGTTDISFTVPKADLSQAMAVLRGLQDEVGAAEVVADSDIAKVSLVGRA